MITNKPHPLKETILRAFLIASGLLLLLPFTNPLSSPLNNPNTPFENYPLALQEAYADATFTPYTERFETSQIEHTSATTHVLTGLLPKYVYDSATKKYKDSFIVKNNTHIKLVNADEPLVFKRSDCTIVKYTDEKFNTKFADYHSTMGLKSGSNAWSVFDALSLSCNYSTFQNATGQYLTVQRIHSKGTFDVTYAKLADGDFKSYMKFKNNQNNLTNPSSSGLQNTRVSFVEVLGNLTASQFLVDGQNKFSSLVQGSQIVWTSQNMTQKVFSFIKGNSIFSIDLGVDFYDLLAVRITKTSATTLDMEIAFGKTANTINYGEVVQRDPAFGWSDGTAYRVTTTSSADTNCNSGSAKDSTPIIFKNDSATSTNCGILAIEFDVSKIPSGSNIRSNQLSITVENVQNGINCDINPVTNRPSTTAASTLYTDISDGTPYVNNNNFCTTTGQKIIDLGTTFETNCEANLSNGWCAIGISFDSLTRDASDHQVIFTNPSISITYGTAVSPNAPTLTVSSSGTTNNLSWTFASNFDNSTQPAIDSTDVYRGNTFYANKSLSDFGSNLESQKGSVAMSTNTLLLHLNSYQTSTTFDDQHEQGGGETDATVHNIASSADFADAYTTNTGWTQTGTLVTVDSGVADKAACAACLNNADNRVHKSLGITLSDTAWIYEFEFKRTDTNGDITLPALLSSGTGDPEDATQDELGMFTGGTSTLGSFYKDGAGGVTTSSTITFTDGTQYYATLQRTSTTNLKLSIFSDSARTTHITGSPLDFTIPATVTTLTTLMHSVKSNGGTQGSTWDIDNSNIWNSATKAGTTALVRGAFPSDSTNNALYMDNSNLNITASDVSTTSMTVVGFVNFTNNEKSRLLAFKNGATEVLFTVDPNYADITRAGVAQTNQTLSTPMGTGKTNLIAFTKNATHACIYNNKTYIGCTANSTALGSITSNLVHVNSNTALAQSVKLTLDEFMIFNSTLSHGTIAKIYERIVPFTNMTAVASAGTTYADIVGTGVERCYAVRAKNSVGDSNPSNIVCTAPAQAIVPQPPINPSAKLNGTTGSYQVDTITIKWTPFNGTWTTGYRVYNSTNNISYSLTTSGLANGTTFYNHNIGEHYKLMYYRVYSEPYTAGSPASLTVYNRTANFPDSPISLSTSTPATGQIRINWSAGASDGNSTRKDCSIRFDNTTTGDAAGWVTEISNSTISSTCTNRQYTKSSLNGGSSYTFQVREGNSQGWSNWSSNVTGTATGTTDITIRLFVNQTGDALQIIPRVTYNSGHTGSALPTLESIRFYNGSSNTLLNSTTINKIFSSTSPTFNYTRMYEDGLGMQGSNYRIVVQVSNYSASGTISTTENATLSNFKAKYSTIYRTAETESEGSYNYTATRNGNQNRLTIAVNRVTDTTFWDLECKFTDQIFEIGTWVNKSSVIAYNITTTVDARNNVIVKCWNDNPVFTLVSYSATNGTLVVTQYTGDLGEFFGVPLPFLIVIFISAMITPKNVPIGLVILTGTIGTMGVMGFWFDSNNNALITGAVWGAIMLVTALGIFRGKTSPY